MGLAIGKPIYDTLKQFGYNDIPLGQDEQPEPNIKRFYRILKKGNGPRVLCTWSSGSNKAPADNPFWQHEDRIINKYCK
jgi:hypothetical protein